MRLRTKIFRQMVLFAIIPSLIIALSAFFILRLAIDRTGSWLSATSPERTINALRLTEYQLQRIAEAAVKSDSDIPMQSAFDWTLKDGVVQYGLESPRTPELDSLILSIAQVLGPIRLAQSDFVIVGFAAGNDSVLTAAGFILDRQYVSGFEAATASLSESRGFKNILPGFILFLITGGAFILLIVISLAYWLSRRLSTSITIPLEQLSRAAINMGRGISAPLDGIGGSDEVTGLAQSFLQMTEELEESRRRRIAAERVAAWQEFARRMAHELKNPLTPISLSLYRIKNTLTKNDAYDAVADSIEAITAEVAHLERLASDYSSLAKLPEPKFCEFDLSDLLSEVIGLYEAQLESIRFTRNIAGSPMIIVADPDRLREAIINILKNAIEFCPQGGEISMHASVTETRTIIELTNTAGDITEADLRAAKLPYVSTRRGGTGLGLAVSEKIILDHGGGLQLHLKSGMTVVRVTIPRVSDTPNQ